MKTRITNFKSSLLPILLTLFMSSCGGDDEPAPPKPVADFSSSTTSVGSGESITFTNQSKDYESLLWTFEGGSPSTSSSESPTITYTTVGTYSVTLQATNLQGSDMKTETGFITVTDTEGPSVVSITPADGATDVPVGVTVEVNFSEPIDANSVENTSFLLSAIGSTTSIGISVSVSNTTGLITITPVDNLQYETEYLLQLSGLRDAAGNPMQSDFSTNFTTEKEPDTTAPTVVSVSPADGDEFAESLTNVIITFSEEIVGADETSIQLINPSGSVVESVVTTAGEIVTLDPINELEADLQYEVKVSVDVTDLAGNNLESQFVSSFIVYEPPVFQLLSCNYCNGATEVPVDANLTIQYTDVVNSIIEVYLVDLSDDSIVPGSTRIDQSVFGIVFTPDAPLKGNTNYLFVASVSGVNNSTSDEIRFTTAASAQLSDFIGVWRNVDTGLVDFEITDTQVIDYTVFTNRSPVNGNIGDFVLEGQNDLGSYYRILVTSNQGVNNYYVQFNDSNQLLMTDFESDLGENVYERN